MEAMSPPKMAAVTPFRLLDLPPELRNRIYSYVFDDSALPELDLLATGRSSPPSAITVTTHQLRSETLGLHQQAMSAFWTDHKFSIYIENRDIFEDSAMDSLLQWCRILPASGLRCISFKINELRILQQVCHPRITTHLEAVLDHDGAEVTWRSSRVLQDEPSVASDDTVFLVARGSTTDLFGGFAEEQGLSLVSKGKTVGLDIGDCAAIVCDYLTKRMEESLAREKVLAQRL
ncbi:hypothetical protein LTR36_010398 [Oleoguttula mirabilis]|uniref:F-box domain-containing protein n=1 Tax=Oleoguttula mirabilis TaxID=1507867 RepID=A0AAV9J485_9PEZI|nr:hypothetical protein LTR36_010398 [Oleoguttula mirabilis]